MDEAVKVHRTCVRVHSADDEEARDEVDFDLPKKNPFIRGSDPRVATCRGRLQTRRCQLNQEINKELRLRAGAENLFKATTNRKLRETVALELSFVNSNLQLLKEQLAELNSSVELYQSDSKDCVMPMIPLGLKETKEVDFREPFKDFILEHYSEDASQYEDNISDFMDMRQAMRTPVRSAAGAALLFKYYNHLYYIERRFFPPDRSLGVYFEWFDSLTGVPSCQRTVAFEKACVLFNIAALYTQVGAAQQRGSDAGLDRAVDAWLRAAGALRYVHDNFTNAPSVDLAADTLLVLTALMTAQARECLLEKLLLQAAPGATLDLAQECAQLALSYTQLYEKMQSEGVFNYVPYSWVSLVHIKTEYYKALCHEYCARGLEKVLSGGKGDAEGEGFAERLDKLYVSGYDAGIDENSLLVLARAHAAEAAALYEEAARLQRMCRELRTKESLCRIVRARAEGARGLRGGERGGERRDDAFDDLIDAPAVLPSSKFQLTLTPPDFSQHRVEDLFKSLGPIAVFSAKRHWSAPRLVQLHRASPASPGSPPSPTLPRRASTRRDRSEDNSTYYSDRVTKHHGLYITSYDQDLDYHPKIMDYDKYEHKTKLSSDSFTENGYKNGDVVNGKSKHRERRKEPLRRAASEYNVSEGKGETQGEGFGFSVRGDAPVVIASVEPNSLADLAGMRAGDLIVSVGGADVKWSSQAQVVRRLAGAGGVLALRLATPMAARAPPPAGSGSVSAGSSASSRGSAPRAPRRAPWNPFRRPSTRALHNDNADVFYRHHLAATTLHSH